MQMLHYLQYANPHRTNIDLTSVLWQTALLLPVYRNRCDGRTGTMFRPLCVFLWVWGFAAKLKTEQEMVNTLFPSWLLGFCWHWPVNARYSHLLDLLDSISFECNTFRLPVFLFACNLLPLSGFNVSGPETFLPHYAQQHIHVGWLKRSNSDFHQFGSFKVRSQPKGFEDCNTAQASSTCQK